MRPMLRVRGLHSPSLLVLLFTVLGALGVVIAARSPYGECVLCRQCGADVTDAIHLINHISPVAHVHVNQTLFGITGVPVQLVQNPVGIRFRFVTFNRASCAAGRTWHNEFSWFPAYMWRHCLCPRCGHHLGWVFMPHTFDSERNIYALSLDKVHGEQFSDSLMIVPKAYQS